MSQNYPFDKQYDTGEGITFNELTGILSGVDDPTIVDITDGRNDIPISTIYIRSDQPTPEIYVKNGITAIEWILLPLSSNVTTIGVQQDDVVVQSATGILNFEGRQYTITDEGSGKVTISIGIGVSEDGELVDGDVISINFIGPSTVADNGGGALTIDTNVAMEEIENADLTGLADNDTLKFDLSELKWVRVPAPPPAPPGTNAIVQFIDDTVDALSGTTTIPKDSSLPLLTEGTEIWTVDFTPVLADSKIRITNSFTLSSSSQNMELIFTLFEDSVCKGTVVGATVEKDSGQSIAFTFVLPSPGTTLVTYSLRIGKVVGSPGSWFVNQISGLDDGFADTLVETGFSISELAILGS